MTAATPVPTGPDRVIEAGWLAALVAVPLFFNVQTYRSFEPDKAILLRLIVLAMLLAWVWKAGERLAAGGGGLALPSILRPRCSGLAPVVLVSAALAWFLDQALATTWSIAPAVSLRGSYHRLQGLYTAGAYLTMFLSMGALLRGSAQRERAVDAMLLASVAVALYGLMQHFGLDPISWDERSGSPVSSTLGNTLFASGFLVMTGPLILARLSGALSATCGGEPAAARTLVLAGTGACLVALPFAWTAGPLAAVLGCTVTTALCVAAGALRRRPRAPYLRVGLYVILLTLLTACVLLTERRGPFVALLCGAGAFALLWTLHRRRWRMHLAVIAVGSLVGVGLLAANLSGPGPSSSVSGLQRLVVVQPDVGSARVRTLIWEATTELVATQPLRALIGYGPETLRLALVPHRRPELGHIERRTATADRAHNATLEIIATTGLLGLALHTTLMMSILCAGLRTVGMLSSARHVLAAGALAIASALALTAGVRFLDGSFRFLGLSVPLGMLTGLVAYTASQSVRHLRSRAPDALPVTSAPPLATMGICAAIVTHFVEIQVGIATVATHTYFWGLAALLASALRPPARCQDGEVDGFPLGRLVAAVIILTLVFDFSTPDLDVMSERRLFWLFSLLAFAIGLFLALETYQVRAAAGRPWLEGAGSYASAFLCAMVGGYWLLRVSPLLRTGLQPALLTYLAALLVLILAMARSLRRGSEPRRRFAPGPALLAAACLPAAYLAGEASLDTIQADIWFKRGRILQQAEDRHDEVTAAYERAITYAPSEPGYHTLLAMAKAEKAAQVSRASERERLFREARAALLEAARLSPLDADHPANLARLYTAWATFSVDPGTRAGRLRQALVHYRRAVDVSPRRPELWNEWGEVYQLLGRPERALERYEHARMLDPSLPQTFVLLGDLYANRGERTLARRAYARAASLCSEGARCSTPTSRRRESAE